MVRALEALRYVGGYSLIALGTAGVAAILLRTETISVLYPAAAILAGAAAIPEVVDFCWRLRRSVPRD